MAGEPNIRTEDKVEITLFEHTLPWSKRRKGGVIPHRITAVIRPIYQKSSLFKYSLEGVFGLEELMVAGNKNRLKQLIVEKVCQKLEITQEELRGASSWSHRQNTKKEISV